MDKWIEQLIQKYPDMFGDWYTGNRRLYVTNSAFVIAAMENYHIVFRRFNPDAIKNVHLENRQYGSRMLVELCFERTRCFEEVIPKTFEELEELSMEYFYEVEKIKKRLLKEERIKKIREL